MRTTLPGFRGPLIGWPAAREALQRMLATERQRLVLWVPVAFGAGVAIHFALPEEPLVWVAPLVTLAMSLCALGSLRAGWRGVACLCVALALTGAGATRAQWRSWEVAAPVLTKTWSGAELTGRVVASEIRPEGRRLVLDRLGMPGLEPHRMPERIRLRIPGEHVLPLAGQHVALRARVVPPPPPVAPGGYDFARWAWFERIGGVGSARGPVRITGGEEPSGWRLALNAARTRLVAWVLEHDPGPAGQISAALLTGEMGHFAPDLMTAMRDSGLAHLLSISGLHITLVAGIVFFAIRRGIALVPPLALRVPAKKIAAAGGMLAITGYMLFAAPGVPTLRAWAMGCVILTAILIDRSPISMRLVAWAAFAILAAMPEALLGASFQMSFAAVLALIAAWEVTASALRRLKARVGAAGGAVAWGVGALLTTTVAGLATAPIALYHFNRVTLYATLANLIAVPLTSVVVMPAAVLVFLLLPFGGATWPLSAMNLANEVVAMIAREVAAWPGATRDVPAMPGYGFALAAFGGLWLALWRSPLRLIGVPVLAISLATPWLVTPPDIRITGDARLVGLRWDPHALSLRGAGNVQMARDTWLRRAGGARETAWPPPDDPVAGRVCDRDGCWIDRDGHLAAIVLSSRGLASACAHATVLITTLDVWRPCPGPLRIVQRADITRSGGLEITLARAGEVRILSVDEARGRRSWTGAPARVPREPDQ
jgi:competence protein ComEC